MRKTKKYEGNYPTDSSWAMRKNFFAEGMGWRLYAQHVEERTYLSYKLCVVGKAPKKANYWIAWSLRKGAPFGKDFNVLQSHRPKIAEIVVGIISEDVDLA